MSQDVLSESFQFYRGRHVRIDSQQGPKHWSMRCYREHGGRLVLSLEHTLDIKHTSHALCTAVDGCRAGGQVQVLAIVHAETGQQKVHLYYKDDPLCPASYAVYYLSIPYSRLRISKRELLANVVCTFWLFW